MLKGFSESIWLMAGIVFLAILAVKILVAGLTSAKVKGAGGELLAKMALKRGLGGDYVVLNDVYLPLPDGTTTQIDHVVVSRYGIFAVETKNYSGWIFGDANSKMWTQSLYRKKSQFQNPTRQNYRHVCAIADNLGIDRDYVKGVVAFIGGRCKFKTEMPEGVVYSGDAARYIRSFTKPIIKDGQVGEIAAVIAEWHDSLGNERRRAHVKNLKVRHAPVTAEAQPPKCPLCGGAMVLLTRRSDGGRFYGCSNFPQCRGVVNVT